VIEMNEHPTKALKEKKDSSIAIGFYLLASGKIDAFISAGNTGAMMVGSFSASKPSKVYYALPLARTCRVKMAH
jgi:glycerol-3-phosphate acyltransferase PlsX